MSDTYTVEIELDSKTGEMILPFPQELIDAVGWNVGDQLIWEETLIWEEDGEFTGFTLRKKDDRSK
jgi:hypothetical protein